MVEQILLSLQVKWSAIACNKDIVYELPHELTKNLRPRILEN